MSHVAEGSLQAYLDGEVDGPAAAGLRDHLASCALCAAELSALRHASEQAHAAIALLDSAPPMLRARAALATVRTATPPRRNALRLGTWGLAKAAMLLLVLAGAGAAAIPDVRRALESTLARVAELFSGSRPDSEPAVLPPQPEAAPARELRQAFIQPADGSVRIQLGEATGVVEVRVALIDGRRADVRTATAEAVRFVSSTGRLEVAGLTEGEVTIGIPRETAAATVIIAPGVRVTKQGGELVLTGPGGTQRGSEVRFTRRP